MDTGQIPGLNRCPSLCPLGLMSVHRGDSSTPTRTPMYCSNPPTPQHPASLEPCRDASVLPLRQLIHYLSRACWKVLCGNEIAENLPRRNPGAFREPRRPKGKVWGQDPRNPLSASLELNPLGAQPLSVPHFLLPSAWNPLWAAIEDPNLNASLLAPIPNS